MKPIIRRSLSVLLALLLVVMSMSAAFGLNSAYPADINEASAATALRRTDVLVKNATSTLSGKTLFATVCEALFADETLSELLEGFYSAADDRRAAMATLGIETSPAALAAHLRAYPSVAARLKNAETWSDADLSDAKWNVKTPDGFATALSAMLSPFNDLLYMLLCGGTANLGPLPVKGERGYETGLVPILRALGCPRMLSPASFYAQAASARSSMIKNIASTLLSLLDAICGAPAAKLTTVLPGLAIFVRDGELEKAVDALLRPLSVRIGPYIELFSGSKVLSVLLFLQSPGQYTLSFTDNVTTGLNNLLESSGVHLAELDLDAFAACKGKNADCFMVLLRWLLSTLRLNESILGDFAPAEAASILNAITAGLLHHGDEWLLSAYVHLLTDAEGTLVEVRTQKADFERGSIEFTKKLKRTQMKRVLSGIDEVLGEFTADSTGDDLTATLRKTLYSSNTVTALVKGLYGAFSGEASRPLGAMLSLPVTPSALARRLPARYTAAKRVLSAARSWESLGNVPWGFAKGHRSGFASALTAVLQPVRPLLEAFLANGVFEVFDAVRVGGTNGYNTAVLPLLEALSCPEEHLKTYDAYVTGKGTDRILTDVLTPVLDLVDQVLKRPVNMLSKLLPNLVFFVQSGGLSDCIEHLLTPVTLLLDTLSLTPEDFGADLSVFRETDLSTLIYDLFGEIEAVSLLDDIDWPLIASLGKETSRESKRTYHGKEISVTYIKSDPSAVLLTLLRGIVTAVKRPENAELLNSMVASAEGDNAMFAQYAESIRTQMDEMTTDELLEWLYQLLFRERAKKEIQEDDDYVPDFNYEPESPHTLRTVLLSLCAAAVLAAGVIVWWRRKEIAAWRARRKARKDSTPEDKEA